MTISAGPFHNNFRGPFISANGLVGGYRVGVGTPPAPSYDPNSVVAARAAGAGGFQITYQNGAAGRDQPDTGACWSFPIVDVFGRSLSKMGVSSLDIPRCIMSFRIRERAFTGASTVLIGIGIGDHVDPASATNGFGISVGYPSTTVRQINRHHINAGAWTTGASGTADVSTFGGAMFFSPSTSTQINRQRCYPLDANFQMDAVPGTNNVEGTSALTATGMTHIYLWTGLSNSAGNGAIHCFDGSAFILPCEI